MKTCRQMIYDKTHKNPQKIFNLDIWSFVDFAHHLCPPHIVQKSRAQLSTVTEA